MRKLTFTSRKASSISVCAIQRIGVFFVLLLSTFLYSNSLIAQCATSSGVIEGAVFVDANQNGQWEDTELGSGNVMVKVYDGNNNLVGQSVSDVAGSYQISGLDDGAGYRIEFSSIGSMTSTYFSSQTNTAMQFASSPTCGLNFGVSSFDNLCDNNPDVALTCFVQGGEGVNDLVETIVALESGFNSGSAVRKLATKKETGSVWGLASKKTTSEIFSASFVKQFAGLTNHGHGAIFRTTKSETSLFAKMSDLGVDVGVLPITDVDDCDYGSQVGRYGLGALVLSSDESSLYTVNLFKNSIVKLSTSNPTEASTVEYSIPDPGCSDGEFQAFALNVHNEKVYVGVTCTAETAQSASESSLNVYEFDPLTGQFDLILSDNYILGYWKDFPANDLHTMHWLTDIGFTRDGNMLLSLTDRLGHRYCNNSSGRLDQQYPDLLMAWNDNGTWRLENNGKAGAYTGSGVGNGDGPGGGEFFGNEFWPSGPDYHNETALGSILVVPGTDEVIATVYDPIFDSYSGGLHRYSTRDGSKLDAIQLYTQTIDPLFGKATGFGALSLICPQPSPEIGNYVWLDSNANGIQDGGEQAIANITIELYDAQCNVVGTTTTDAKGNYIFNNSNVDLDLDGEMDGLNNGEKYYVKISNTDFDTESMAVIHDGNNYILSTNDVGFGTQSNENDSDAALGVIENCESLGEGIFVEVDLANSSAINHSFDIGLMAPQGFDLALLKKRSSNVPVRIGELVSFDITVYNQGSVRANKFTITDYLQPGFRFVGANNPGWTLNGDMASYNVNTPLNPGETITIPITLELVKSVNGKWLNFAEISKAVDQFDDDSSDIDSTPDQVDDNDNGGVPNSPSDDVITDDNTFDEDDHDGAMVEVFDLALNKKLLNPDQIYSPGDQVSFVMSVFNQGNVRAKTVTISDNLPADLIFNPASNPGWTAIGNNMVSYTITDELSVGEMDEVVLHLNISANAQGSSIINYAEISDFTADNPDAMDFDSTPDLDMSNDIGGEVNTLTDNEIDDNGILDEDDHDPAVVNLERFDLALKKVVSSSLYVRQGDTTTFKIYVYNQGSRQADRFTVVDYINPEFSFPEDLNPDWNYDSGIAKIKINDALLPGENTSFEIKLIVENGNLPELLNFAEISSASTSDGTPLNDVDSTPDEDMNNDNGGVPNAPQSDDFLDGDGSLDEDDHDPARLIPVNSSLTESCFCLDNATATDPGQFRDEITIVSDPGQTWYIHSVVNLFDLPATMPGTPFVTGPAGFTMTEGPAGTYTMQGIHDSGAGYSIILTNGNGFFETISGGCSYDTPVVEGPVAACNLGTTEYTTEEMLGATYQWTVSPAGPVIVGSSTDYFVEIDWSGAAAGDYTVELVKTMAGACIAPSTLNVAVGTAVGAIACVGELNMSLGADCELEVTPLMVLAGVPTSSAGYAVMLLDANGEVIPNNTLTTEHIGMQVVFKLIDGCSGNLCWGYITAEDKLAPEVLCEDITLSCAEMLTYQGPLAVDNCDSAPTVTLLSETDVLLECDDDFIRQIDRTYQATDAWGNVSSVCSQTIMLERINLDKTVNFTDDLDVANWVTTVEGDGVVDVSGAPNTITLTGSNNGVISATNGTDFCITVTERGSMVFNWTYVSSNSNSSFDPFGYYHNGLFYSLTDGTSNLSQSGHSSVFLNEGDEFCFSAESTDGGLGAATTIVSGLMFSEIDFPQNFMMVTENPLACGSFATDDSGHPHPDVTGVPMLNGDPVYPTFAGLCNVTTGYSDNVISNDGCIIKIIRTWVVSEWWCDDSPFLSCEQVIEIVDDQAPTFTCPDNMTVQTNGSECSATFVLPSISPIDNCNQVGLSVNMDTPVGTMTGVNGGVITLPVGSHQITYTALDVCLNASQCTIDVIVEDFTAPVAVCDQFTVVSLNEGGEAEVFASVFDDGSYDECGLLGFEVRRMDSDAICRVGDDEFGESIVFCCTDVGESRVVVFRVYDINGNYNDCMVNVEVQDKFAPTITCPADGFVDCGYDFSQSDFSEFGEATAVDACEVTITSSEAYFLDQCGEGYVERTFVASDANGSAQCTQRIYVTNPTPFTCLDVIWPQDYDSQLSCLADDLSPDNLPSANAYPQVTEDACDLVGMSYVDALFPFEDDNNSCFKIVRTWTIIDWCEMDTPGYVPCEHSQVIKISNFTAPVIIGDCEPISVCTFDPECMDGFVELTVSATDDCTPNNMLQWTYVIDVNMDGTNLMTDSGVGSTIDVSTVYPLGTHTILYTFEDQCGNSTSCLKEFTVVNCKPPTAYCIDGLSIALIPMDLDEDGEIDTEMACLFSDQIDAGSFHSCGYDVDVSFSADVDDDKLVFDCFDIGDNEVTLWVTDENGNTSICNTTIEVQDNNDVDGCPDPEECIIYPEAEITVSPGCDADLSPEALNSMVTIIGDCDCDDFTISFNDGIVFPYPNSTCSYITRIWTIDIGCNAENQQVTFNQTLFVVNQAPPQINCPANVTVSNTAGNCETFVAIGDPIITAPCNTGITITNNSAFADSNVGNASGVYPVGITDVTYTVTDECGNSNTCITTVTVLDGTPPDCQSQNITVAIDANGVATITANDVNNGSSDDCTHSLALGLSLDVTEFGCDDLGENVVTLTVTDFAGNTSQCTATVTVEDITSPLCIAQDLSLSLDANGAVVITADQVDNGSTGGCSSSLDLSLDQTMFDCDDVGDNIVILTVTSDNGMSSQCSATITITDDTLPSLSCPANITVACDADTDDLTAFGIPSVSDNCPGVLVSEIVTRNTNNCGAGLIIRTFTATDASNNVQQCAQFITVGLPSDIFDGDTDIAWPATPVNLTSCLDDTDTGSPVLSIPNTDCANISIDFVDVDTNPTNVCPDTILRTWTVIDSCQLDNVSGDGIFTFDQTIIIQDTDAPIINVSATEPLPDTIFIVCQTELNFVAQAVDCNLVSFTNDSPFANSSVGGDISGDYPMSEFYVRFEALDACGNSSIDSVFVSSTGDDITPPVMDCKKLMPELDDSGPLSITLMPEDFVCLLSDNCSDSIDIDLFFVDPISEDDPTFTNPTQLLTVDCDDVDIMQPVYIVAVDEVGNFSFCQSLVTLLDPLNVCTMNLVANVEGVVRTENDIFVETVEIDLQGADLPVIMTNDDGEYGFPNMPTGGTYTVMPEKDINDMEGVSTLDLILIQKHILQLQTLDSPYKIIAADINRSNTITASDLIELRKLILGVYNELPNNTSWRMIDASYEFPIPADPFAELFPEEYYIDQLNSNMNVDFIGVKIGDVNASYDGSNLIGGFDNRFDETVILEAKISQMSNDNFVLGLYPENLKQVNGFQLTFEFDNSNRAFIDIDSDVIDLEDSNISLNRLENGLITISWNSLDEVSLNQNEPLLEFTFNGKAFDSNEQLDVNSKITNAELYSANQIRGLELRTEFEQARQLTLFQNVPNPWRNNTQIKFSVVDSDELTMKIFDVAGKLILNTTKTYLPGIHTVELTSNQFPARGIYYIELSNSETTVRNKMILIN